MKQITMNEHIAEVSQTNPVINNFISSHIYDWTCFCNYNCQMFKKNAPFHIYFDFLDSRIVGLSIGSMLQMEEKKILSLLSEKASLSDYSELEIWMLSQIKVSVMTVYSAFSNRRIS